MRQELEKLYRIPITDLSDDGDVKVRKWKTFEEICPMWSNWILTKQRQKSEMDIMNHKYCFVGEAHGWDSSYGDSRTPDKYCSQCVSFSGSFIIVFTNSSCGKNNDPRNQNIINRFVNHWNEAHNK